MRIKLYGFDVIVELYLLFDFKYYLLVKWPLFKNSTIGSIMSNVNSLLSCPADILFEIFTRVEPSDIAPTMGNMANTCSKMNALCQNNELWRKILDLKKNDFLPPLKEIPKVDSLLEFYKSSRLFFKYDANGDESYRPPANFGPLINYTILCDRPNCSIEKIKNYLKGKMGYSDRPDFKDIWGNYSSYRMIVFVPGKIVVGLEGVSINRVYPLQKDFSYMVSLTDSAHQRNAWSSQDIA